MLVAAALAMASGAGGGELNPDARAEALEAIRSGRAKEAAEILEAALKEDPGAIELHELLGTALLRSGRLVEARKAFELILRAFPERRQVRLWLAQLLENQGVREAARVHYERQLEGEVQTRDGVWGLARMGLARISLESGDLKEARKAIANLAGEVSAPDLAQVELRILRAEGKLEEAIAFARRNLSILPKGKEQIVSLLRDKAHESQQNKDLEGAIALLREAALYGPSPPILMDLAFLYKQIGDQEACRETLQRLLAAEGPVEDVVTSLGDLLILSGTPREALVLARAALEKDPDARFARILELKALAALGGGEELLDLAGRLARAHGSEAHWAVPILEALETLQRPSRVAEVWLAEVPSTPAEAVPALARLLWNAGLELVREGEPARARELFRKAFELQPADIGIRRDLGWATLKAGDREGALSAWKPLLQSDTADPGVSRESLKVFRDLGRFEEGIECGRRALKNYPEARDIHRAWWDLLAGGGRREELLRCLDPDVAGKEPEDVAAVARLILRYRKESSFRDLLARWRSKRSDDETLRKVEAYILYQDAKEARRAGDLREAISFYRASIDLNPALAAAHRGLAVALRASGDFSGAIPFFRKAVRLEPEDQEGRAWLARALREQRRNGEARAVIAEVEEAVMAPALRLEAARLAFEESRLKDAVRLTRSISQTLASEEIVRAALEIRADALTGLGEMDSALRVLLDLARSRPQDPRPYTRIYRTAVHAGRRDWAIGILKKFARDHRDLWGPYLPLIQDAFSREDLESARVALQRYLALRPQDVDKWNLLGQTEDKWKDFAAAGDAFRSALAVSPLDSFAQVGLASAELKLGRVEEALVRYDEILARNPEHFYAHVDKVDALERMGDLEGALREWDEVHRILPDEIDHLLQRARLLSGMRRYREAIAEAEEFLRRVDEGVLPVLLYHSVSPRFDEGSLPAVLFRDQMRALREAGYTAVSLNEVLRWIRGEKPLPSRAILITFDDARSDNIAVADPILEEFGFRAVEFVITGVVVENSGHYMSWSDLKSLEATERWEFGAHGHKAHQKIAMDRRGNRALFLSTRSWLPNENRTETRSEMERRVQADARQSLEAFRQKGFRDPIAFAFPYGNFGHLDITNLPDACSINLRMLQDHFRIGFLQPRGVYNLRQEGRKAALLTRFSVPEDWDGERLLRHLQESHPRVKGLLNLARFQSWSGRYARALENLDRAEVLGAPEVDVEEIRSRALLWQGDLPRSRDSIDLFLDSRPDDLDALESLARLELAVRPSVAGRFEFWQDSEDREVLHESARGAFNLLPWLRAHCEAGYATYSEKGLKDIGSVTGEVGGEALLRGPLKIGGAFGADWFDRADDALHYSSEVLWKGLDLLYIEGHADGGPVKTPSAVTQGIRLDAQSLMGSFNFWPDDNVYLTYRQGFYSDGNFRKAVRAQYGHRFLIDPSLRIGYDGIYDDAQEDPEAYYGPENLFSNSAFFHLQLNPTERFSLDTRAGAGYGWERGEGHFVFQGVLGARWRALDWLEVSGSWGYFRNPNYWSNVAEANLQISF